MWPLWFSLIPCRFPNVSALRWLMYMQKSAWSRVCHAMMGDLWDVAGCCDGNISVLILACTISMYATLTLHIAVQLEISMSWLKERIVRTRASGCAKANWSARSIASECHIILIASFSIAKKPWEFYYLEHWHAISPDLLEVVHTETPTSLLKHQIKSAPYNPVN